MEYPLTDELKAELKERIRALCKPMQPQPTNQRARTRKLPGVRAVLFDIYGTLLTAGVGEVGAQQAAERTPAEAALKASGFECIDAEAGHRAVERLLAEIAADHQQARAGGIEWPEIDIREIWQRVIETLLGERHVRGVMTPEAVQRLAVEYECRVNPAWPMPALRETLAALRERNILLGVVSNAQFYTPLVMEVFEETGWSQGWFEPDLGAWSYELRAAKPGLQLVEHALAVLGTRHGIGRDAVLCVGNDLLNDITPGARLGCRTALFAGDARSLRLREGDARCEGVEPDIVILGLGDLLAALD